MAKTILVVDDSTSLRLVVKMTLEGAGYDVIEAADGQQALALLDGRKIHLVLSDLNMPVMNGVQTTRVIRERHPHTAVLVLTTYADDDWLFDAIRAGAHGYLLKDTRRDDLVRAILGAAQGQSYLDPNVAGKVMQMATQTMAQQAQPHEASDVPDVPIETLSEREREIVRLISQGLSNPEIAERLHLAHGTVRNYVSEIIAKLGAADRTHAAILAAKQGWI